MIPNKILKVKSIFWAVIGAVIITGCAAGSGDSGGEKAASDAATFDAPVDAETGNVIALWVEYRETVREEGDMPILVTELLGCYMSWNEGDRLFMVYDNAAKLVFKTTDFDAFLDHFASLPRGSAIQYFNTCTVSRTWGMPDDARERLRATMKARELSWAISEVRGTAGEIICYCESEGFRFPSPAPGSTPGGVTD